ncbi:MAG TPA: IS1634 family transposase [Solirubrobacteraceae bacterium]|nr:IS1634 family transposase [Solirubrobacteraceae bacterium]
MGVYLRHSIKRKDGKTHTYWRLVRSVRRGRKVVQETIANLGELDAQGRAKAKQLLREMTGRTEQRELFEAVETGPETVAVRLDRVRLERGRTFGDVWLGWTLWRALRLDELCQELMPEGREAVPWSTMAAVLVLARLCEPSSELHIAEDWYRRTALEDMLGVPAGVVNDDRLYRALDELLPHKVRLEQHIRKRLGELFSLDYDLLLYDVTSTYFEGQVAGNAQAQRGHSRDHRPDCKQVCIALVVTREGIPLGYEVFAGNRVDVTTVEEIVGTMEARYGMANRIWVMDRGMTSADNVAWLQQTGRRYLIGTSKSELKRFSREIAEARDWKAVREGIEAKLCESPDGTETFILCRSVERREKERAMHGRFAARIEEGLTSLGRRIEHSRAPLDRGPLERQLGRLLGRNSRAAGRYLVRLVEDETLPARLRLEWSARPEWDDWARHSEGCYVLRTNVTDWTSEDLWRTYVQLTEAEAAFRIHKSDLSLRPVWHHKAERAQAHILVCFLAYVLWKTLEQWQKRAGLGNSPRTILEELGRIQSTDVVLPLAENAARELRIRCVVRPDKAQAALLDRLGLRLPERLRSPISPTKM